MKPETRTTRDAILEVSRRGEVLAHLLEAVREALDGAGTSGEYEAMNKAGFLLMACEDQTAALLDDARAAEEAEMEGRAE